MTTVPDRPHPAVEISGDLGKSTCTTPTAPSQALTLCASADRCALDPDCHAYPNHSTLDPGGKW